MYKKIKILLVNHDSTYAGGGANDDFVRILRHLWNTGKYEIDCAFPEGDRVPEYLKYCNKHFFYTKVFFPVRYISLLHYYGFFKLYLKNKKEFAEILRNSDYDVALINVSVLIWPAVFIKKRNVKEIFFIRELVQPKFLQKIIFKKLKNLGDYFFAVSENLKQDFTDATGLHNVTTINSAIESDIDENPATDDELFSVLENYNLRKENLFSVKNLICIGSVNERKNQILIINALGKMKQSNSGDMPRLFLAGDFKEDPQYYEEMKNAISKFNLSDKVFFLGHLQKKNLYKLLSRMDALVISSKSEGLPLVLVEALKFKIPVITSYVGGIKDIIKNKENGVTIDLTVDSLIDALSKLDDKGFINEITRNGYKTFNTKFNLEENFKIIENKIDSIVQ